MADINGFPPRSVWNYGGDGSDGDTVVTTTITLARDMYYNTLVVSGAGIINTANYRIFCKVSLVNNATIRNNGTSATSTSGAAVVAAGTLATGTAGGAGGTAAGTAGTNATNNIGAAGGAGGAGSGGAGGAAGGVTGYAAIAGGPNPHINPGVALYGQGAVPASLIACTGGTGGGGGGGDGTAGGGGGAGAGVMMVFSPIIIGTGLFSALGGDGFAAAAGNRGGGGGGGGGFIYTMSDITPASTLTFSVVGGAGGAKTGTGVVGTSGNTGTVFKYTMLR